MRWAVRWRSRRRGRRPTAPAPVAAPARRPRRHAVAAPPPPIPASCKQYCLTCHNERAKVGGLCSIPRLDHVGTDRRDLGEGGPQDQDRHDAAERHAAAGRATLDGFAAALEARLDRANPPGAHPDAPALHRLNRTEYANAIRDLLALDVDVKALLPPDDSNEGFDNIAEALTVSPSLIQGYVGAAMKISRQAVGDRSAAPAQVTYSAPGPAGAGQAHRGLPLGTRGGLLITHNFPLDAVYEFSLGGGGAAASSAARPRHLDVTHRRRAADGAQSRGFRQKDQRGPHVISVAIVDRQRGAGRRRRVLGLPDRLTFTPPVASTGVTITGPFDPSGTGDTPSQKKGLRLPTVCRDPGRRPGARRIVSTLARRAFRQPRRQPTSTP
jgi:hypothetical protein